MTNRKRLFYDIETSFNTIADFSCGWNKTIRPNQIIKERQIICISYKWEGEISARWKSDNQQDLKLPKLIRPVVLAYTWILLTILVVMYALGVSIDSIYITVFEVLALAVNGAYFGARTIEKYHKEKYDKS